MGKLLNLAVYNPAILDDADFLAGFVARQDLAASLLARLGEITPRGQARHHLILGQRGMGKTSLLRRLALGVREDAALAAVLLPLTFREEQYNVHNLHTFWLNCLDALGDYFEKTGQADKADEIDRDIATLMPGEMDVEGVAALEVFKRWARREGRRPLLLLDNVDFILDGLKAQHWSLRRVMQEAGGIVVVGASAAYLEATADPKGAFYDFFQVTVLEKLSQDELIACLRRLAQQRGEEGCKVLNVLNRDPGRIRALHDLTGGNPRTLVLLYLLLELDAEGDVFSDLERLLDQVTVLYKSRVEDLAPQARVVLDAVALAWNPVTAADVAAATALDTSAVSTQLDRLQKNGVVEKVSLSSTARAGFQLGERFFNIWYLMRHGPRRQKARLRWLTSFLRSFYSPAQLTEQAIELLKANSQPERHGKADTLFETLEARSPSSKAGLLRAFRALAMDNFGEASLALESLIKEDQQETEFNPTHRDLLRLLRLAAARGYGDKLLAWLDEKGHADHYWPLRVAFDAYLHGEAKLMDVNPEVRSAAKRIYNWLDSARRAQATKTEESGKASPSKRKRIARKSR
jgi:hypothetical protein